jgi:hypothetical protein
MRPQLIVVTIVGIFASSHWAIAQPLASLGQPVPSATLGSPKAAASQPVVRASSPDPLVGDYPRAAQLGEISEARFGPSIDASSANTPEERFNWGLPEPATPRRSDSSSRYTSQSQFGDKLGEIGTAEGSWFHWNYLRSDHCFDTFVSPMTNPFLAEDPRALTEIRPIFMFQTIPHGSAINGGNVEFFGMRGSIAFTDRFSLTLDKLGGLVLNPGAGSTIGNGTGFTEIWLGPKVTFYKDDQTGTIAAAGAIFQIPTGSSSTFQNTGNLSIVPYGTAAQKFGRFSWGEFQVLDTLGYAFSVDDRRSDYFYNTIHLDFDVANASMVYPLIELNWFHYTSNGQSRVLPFEGGDIANVGSAAAGRDYLNIAVGSRFKVTEAAQFGIAAEFPLLNTKDLFNFRLGIDFIWRY